jgi:hypothetical protein
MDYCMECIKNDIWKPGQGHHIISRKKATYMKHVPMNIAPLCEHHHTASPTGIHHNKEMMLRYRQEFQLQLQLLLDKQYYTHKELKSLLNCSDNTVKAITKTIPISKEGYDRERLIFHMCGDQNYLEVE